MLGSVLRWLETTVSDWPRVLTRVLGRFLFEVSPTDAVSIVASAALVLLLALASSYLPARRASRVDPAVALRAE